MGSSGRQKIREDRDFVLIDQSDGKVTFDRSVEFVLGLHSDRISRGVGFVIEVVAVLRVPLASKVKRNCFRRLLH